MRRYCSKKNQISKQSCREIRPTGGRLTGGPPVIMKSGRNKNIQIFHIIHIHVSSGQRAKMEFVNISTEKYINIPCVHEYYKHICSLFGHICNCIWAINGFETFVNRMYVSICKSLQTKDS